jgi:ABC-type lipoprotein export system ATPase subunit
MSLLELENVGRSFREGQLERVALREVSLELDAGELAMVWGMRRAGRSTLLRVAAGIETPDTGVVRFEGRDLARHGEDVLGAGLGFCQKTLAGDASQPVLELVMLSLLAAGLPAARARPAARDALERAGVERCAALRICELDTAESVRVALARVLARQPRLIVIDDPIDGVDLLERDGILLLLRSLADQGTAVLASSTDSTGLSGADRAFSLSEGVLRGPDRPELAPVVALRRPARRRASG